MENWLPNKKRLWTEKTYDKAIKSIQKHIYSTFGQRDFRDITSKEWCEYFQSLVNELKIPTQMRKLFLMFLKLMIGLQYIVITMKILLKILNAFR